MLNEGRHDKTCLYNMWTTKAPITLEYLFELYTIIFLSFRTDRPGKTVQTQIRLLLKEQCESDQGLHCLQFPLHLLDALL